MSDCVNFLHQLGIQENLKLVMSLDLAIPARVCSKVFEITMPQKYLKKVLISIQKSGMQLGNKRKSNLIFPILDGPGQTCRSMS